MGTLDSKFDVVGPLQLAPETPKGALPPGLGILGPVGGKRRIGIRITFPFRGDDSGPALPTRMGQNFQPPGIRTCAEPELRRLLRAARTRRSPQDHNPICSTQMPVLQRHQRRLRRPHHQHGERLSSPPGHNTACSQSGGANRNSTQKPARRRIAPSSRITPTTAPCARVMSAQVEAAHLAAVTHIRRIAEQTPTAASRGRRASAACRSEGAAAPPISVRRRPASHS